MSTLAGTWIGFYIQAREQRRVRQDNLIREGHLRLHAERLTSYCTFYLEGGHMRHALRLLGDGPDEAQLRGDAETQRSTLWEAGTSVTLVDSVEAAGAAWDLMSYARKILKGRAELDLDLWVKLIWTFVDNARHDIQFPDAPDAPDTPPLGLWEGLSCRHLVGKAVSWTKRRRIWSVSKSPTRIMGTHAEAARCATANSALAVVALPTRLPQRGGHAATASLDHGRATRDQVLLMPPQIEAKDLDGPAEQAR